jgi:Zn-dependent protease
MEVQKEDRFHEIIEFAVMVIWMGIAFGIFFAGGINAFQDMVVLRNAVLESLVVVFFAFVFHELAHRIAARRYGFHAVFHVWIPGLLLALGGAFVGFLFAAPGGVQIQIPQDTVENRVKLGKSALAGPVANMVLTVAFTVFTIVFLYFVKSYEASTGKTASQLASWINTTGDICVMGMEINSLLAAFNLLPWGNFDGYKVFHWNKKVWLISLLISIGLFVFVYVIVDKLFV